MKYRFFLRAAVIACMAVTTAFSVAAQDQQSNKLQRPDDYQFKDGIALHKDFIDRELTKKMRALQRYITILVKKEPGYMKAIDNAMLLFNNDETKLVSVSNKKNDKIAVKPIRQYLNDVARLPYQRVDITYRNYTAIEHIRRQPDGSYRGVAVFEQEFKGFDKEGNAMYSDVVKRNAEVLIKIREYIKDNKDTASVHIFFGNIGVSQL